jgi:hypothetical protein
MLVLNNSLLKLVKLYGCTYQLSSSAWNFFCIGVQCSKLFGCFSVTLFTILRLFWQIIFRGYKNLHFCDRVLASDLKNIVLYVAHFFP